MIRMLAIFLIAFCTVSMLFGCGGSSSGEQQAEVTPILPDTYFGLYSFELPLTEQEGECEVVPNLEDSVMLVGEVPPGENGAIIFDSNIGLWEGAINNEDELVDFTVMLMSSEGGCNRTDTLDVSVRTIAPGQASLRRFYDCFSASCLQTFEGDIAQFTPNEDS